GGLSEETRKVMLDTGVKYELSRGAHEYVQAAQRVNTLRKAMKLRGILWDMSASRDLVLSAWYTCETGDWELKDPKKNSPFYTNIDDEKRGPGGPLKLAE